MSSAFLTGACVAVILALCVWWFGIHAPRIEQIENQTRQMEASLQNATNEAVQAQQLYEDQTLKDVAAKNEMDRMDEEASRMKAARQESERKFAEAQRQREDKLREKTIEEISQR